MQSDNRKQEKPAGAAQEKEQISGRPVLLLNTRIYGHPEADGIVIENNRIIETGSSAKLLKKYHGRAEGYDLQGICTFPGFVDSHLHLYMTGQALRSARLQDCRSIQEVQESLAALLEKRNAERKEGEPLPLISGMGWHQDNFAEKRMLCAADLDAVSKDAVIIAQRACTHLLCANSAAMEKTGLFREDGIFTEGDCTPFLQLLEEEEQKIRPQIIEEAIEHCLNTGLTGVQCCEMHERDFAGLLPVYRDLSAKLRMRQQVCITGREKMEEFLQIWPAFETGSHRFAGFKGFADGALGARTAAMKEDYADAPGIRGTEVMSAREMEKFVQACANLHVPAYFHAIGDLAIEHCLQAFESAENPQNRENFGLLHIQITEPEQIERLCADQIHAYVQPIFWKADQHILRQRVGEAKAASSYDFAGLAHGTLLLMGTDSPIEDCDPVENIRYALHCPHPLTLAQAVDGYTINAAISMGRAHELGRIEPGYLADLSFFEGTLEDPETWKAVNVMVNGTLHRPFEGRQIL